MILNWLSFPNTSLIGNRRLENWVLVKVRLRISVRTKDSNELQKENMMMKWKAKNAYKANLQQLMKVEDNDFIFHVCEELNYLKKDGKHST